METETATNLEKIIENLRKSASEQNLLPGEVALDLKNEGYEPQDIAYILFHGLNVSGECLIEALALGSGFSLVETARAIFAGLWWSPSDLAGAFFNFNTSVREMGAGEAVIETANILLKAGVFVADEDYDL